METKKEKIFKPAKERCPSEAYNAYYLPLSDDFREIRIALPKELSSEEIGQFIRLAKAIVEGDYLGNEPEYNPDDYIPVLMFLTGINLLDVGTEREIKYIGHSVKLKSGKIGFIGLPEMISDKEISMFDYNLEKLIYKN